MYRYVGGKVTYYPRRREPEDPGEQHANGSQLNGSGTHLYENHANLRRAGPKNLLTEEQRLRLQSFVDRFDAAGGLEPAFRLVAAEVHTFFPFQACKTLQRLAKRFGAAPAADRRLPPLTQRCASTMPGADGVSISRALWALGKMGVRDERLLHAAAARLPDVLAECGPITIATAWNAFEVLQFEHEDCLRVMAEEVLRRLTECDPPEIAIVLHAAAQLRFSEREKVFEVLVPHVRDNIGSFSARHLAVCFHAAARVSVRDDELCRLVARRFTRDLADIDALALTSAVYACGLVAFLDETFFEAVSKFVQKALGEGGRGLESQQIANIVYTFGKLGFCPEKTLHTVAQHAITDFWRFKEQELDNLTYGLALLKFRSEPYLGRLTSHLVEGGRVEKLDAQSLVSMAYSQALLGYLHHPTLRAIGDRAIPKLPHFKPEEFSILVYSLGLLNFRHHDLLTAMVEHVPDVLPRFTTQNISNFLHGLGLVTFDRDDAFVRHVASHLVTRLPECSAQDIANPVTALMRMIIPHDELLNAAATFVTSPGSKLPLMEFTPQEIANTVYGFDGLQLFHRELFEQVSVVTQRRLEEFIPQEVANVIWAFCKQSFGSAPWFENVLSRCAPHAERLTGTSSGHTLSVLWCAEDLEKPLAALWPLRSQLPSYARLERVFRARFLDKISAFLQSLAPQCGAPPPSQYQKDFASWDLYQVGPSFTEELLAVVGVCRAAPSAEAERALLEHYAGGGEDSLIARYGDRLLISVLPAARWLSSRIVYRLTLLGCDTVLEGTLVVEPAHPKEDDEANQRRFKAESWREPADPTRGPFRPVLLSTFLGNWRHRHTEIVALDLLMELALGAVADGRWTWMEGFWERLGGDLELFVPHTPCLSCVGAFAQLRCWSPRLAIRVSYYDWREWRRQLLQVTGRL